MEGGPCQRQEYTWYSAGDVCGRQEYCEGQVKCLGRPEEEKCSPGWDQAVNTDNLIEKLAVKEREEQNGTSREQQR